MKCQICNKRVDGKIKIIDSHFGEITVCNNCLNDFASNDYDSMCRKLEENAKR